MDKKEKYLKHNEKYVTIKIYRDDHRRLKVLGELLDKGIVELSSELISQGVNTKIQEAQIHTEFEQLDLEMQNY